MTDCDNTTKPTCSIHGCKKSATRKSATLCEMHYARIRRNGISDRLPVNTEPIKHTSGYVLVYAPNHPLSTGTTPRIYEHRFVYYNEYGNGPFDCYWCKKIVGWHNMHVDHLNAIVDDNRINNLVASCPTCNQARGQEKMRMTQRNNSIRRYTAHGMTMCIAEWAAYLGLSRNSLEYRINAGWDFNKVFSARIGASGKKSGFSKRCHDTTKKREEEKNLIESTG